MNGTVKQFFAEKDVKSRHRTTAFNAIADVRAQVPCNPVTATAKFGDGSDAWPVRHVSKGALFGLTGSRFELAPYPGQTHGFFNLAREEGWFFPDTVAKAEAFLRTPRLIN